MMDLGAKAHVRWSIKLTDFYVNNEKMIFKKFYTEIAFISWKEKQVLEKHTGVILSGWKKGKVL